MRERKFIDLLRKTKWSKWAHRFSYRLKVCWKSGTATRYLILPVTESVGQNGPLKKPDELRAGIRKFLPVSLPGARVQRGVGRLRRPQKATGLLKHRPSRQARPALCRGQGWNPCPVIWCCASYPTGYYLAQNGGRSSSFAAAFSTAKLLKRRLEKSFIVRLFTYNK